MVGGGGGGYTSGCCSIHVPIIETGRILEETFWGIPWWWEVPVGKAVVGLVFRVVGLGDS